MPPILTPLTRRNHADFHERARRLSLNLGLKDAPEFRAAQQAVDSLRAGWLEAPDLRPHEMIAMLGKAIAMLSVAQTALRQPLIDE